MTHRRLLRLAALALLPGLLVLARPAAAAPLEAKRAQAEALEARIREQGRRLSLADEDYNEARLETARLQARADSARALVATAEQHWAALRDQLGRRARMLYMHPGAALDAFFGAQTLGEISRAHVYGGQVLLTDTDLMLDAERARQEVLKRARGVESLQGQAERKQDELASRRVQVQHELGAQRTLLRSVRGDIAKLIAEQRAKEAAAAAQAAQRAAMSGTPSVGATEAAKPASPPPAARASAAKALETARAQIGKPYEFGAAGPSSFDCSGLTMYAWESAGVSLPHSSRAQFSSLPHVAKSQLQPGDLVFFGSPIHHVGIYEGGGTMINAPETGESVRRDSISRSDYAGASRP